MANSPEELALELETLIDTNSFYHVLEALVNVCGEKEEHVRTNWQDSQLAGDWSDIGERLAGVLWKTPEGI